MKKVWSAKDWSADLLCAPLLLQRSSVLITEAVQGREKRNTTAWNMKWFAAAEWFDQQLRKLESVHYHSRVQSNASTGKTVTPVLPFCHTDEYLIPKNVSTLDCPLSPPSSLHVILTSLSPNTVITATAGGTYALTQQLKTAGVWMNTHSEMINDKIVSF